MRHALAPPVLAALALLTGCGAAPAAAPAAPVPPTVAATPAAAPAVAPAPVSAAPTAPQSWSMPDLVGSGLQQAQDDIQGLTGFGIAITTSHDATGEGRLQVSDRNWKVCDQSVPPGAAIGPGTKIDFGAVKLDESC